MVGDNFDAIVLDESKDVLEVMISVSGQSQRPTSLTLFSIMRFSLHALEYIYTPWCGHCQALESIQNKLAKHLRGIESLVIVKMDETSNEHPRTKVWL